MDLQYSDRDVGYLFGVWFVALGFLAASTIRPDYSPVVSPVGDPALFISLCGLIVLGAATARLRDFALGMPMAVGGGLVVWSVGHTLATDPRLLTSRLALAAGGLIVLGGLFVREGVVIARGRRHTDTDSPPRTRWQWWLAALVLFAAGSL